MKKATTKATPANTAAPERKATAKKAATTKKAAPEEEVSEEEEAPAPQNVIAQPAQKEPVFRYSDEELQEFKDRINERLDVAREELQFLQGQMIGKDSSGVEDSSDLRLSLEDGSGAMDREQLSQLTSRQVQYISNLEKALIRIHNKTYGVCRETGKLIDKARLRAVPHATLSIEAKKNASKK